MSVKETVRGRAANSSRGRGFEPDSLQGAKPRTVTGDSEFWSPGGFGGLVRNRDSEVGRVVQVLPSLQLTPLWLSGENARNCPKIRG